MGPPPRNDLTHVLSRHTTAHASITAAHVRSDVGLASRCRPTRLTVTGTRKPFEAGTDAYPPTGCLLFSTAGGSSPDVGPTSTALISSAVLSAYFPNVPPAFHSLQAGKQACKQQNNQTILIFMRPSIDKIQYEH